MRIQILRPSLKSPRTWLVSAVLVFLLATVAGVFLARAAFAKISMNTIDPVGLVADHGRAVTLTGPINVTAGERTELRVTLTQRSTGAVGEGILFFTGTGQIERWEVRLSTQGAVSFEPGAATAVGLARSSSSSVRGQATDAHQWLVNVNLESE
jgi:hypothetical protein